MTPNELENKIQKELFSCVDGFNSFYFSAGAGAGKTHALIEVLKYIVNRKLNYNKTLQQVACITYTNIAVSEITKRLGNSDAVMVSTIHDRLWDIIKRYQPELIICHKEKITKVIQACQHDLANEKRAQFYKELNGSEKEEFKKYVIETKGIFYRKNFLSSRDFKELYNNYEEIKKPDFFDRCIKNLENFSFVVKRIHKIDSLEVAITRINDGKIKRVNYDSNINTDMLHRMKFSHETLLEYGLILVARHPILCRIIIDRYPYFFIDECQDSHENVIRITKKLHDYAVEKNKKWLVGYFGDAVQNIYDDGVGETISEIHYGTKLISKHINRRSHQQIIDVCNKIRADSIVQIPIDSARNIGEVKFYYDRSGEKISTAREFLERYKSDLKENNLASAEKKHIHCLVLTNKLMAEFSGFIDVYEVYSKSNIFYNELNTKVLSQNKDKLHSSVLFIYYLVKLYQDIQHKNVSYFDVFGVYSKNMTFYQASKVIRELGEQKFECLKSWVECICYFLDNSEAKTELAKALMNRLKIEEDKTESGSIFRDMMMDTISILMNPANVEETVRVNYNESLLEMSMESLMRWSDFIDAKKGEDITFHTYHGSKGEEYENVAIILEHDFGTQRKKFKSYFENVGHSESCAYIDSLDFERRKLHINTRNLLYVACSRAIKNLRVLYLDDINDIDAGINTIFSHVENWRNTSQETSCSD